MSQMNRQPTDGPSRRLCGLRVCIETVRTLGVSCRMPYGWSGSINIPNSKFYLPFYFDARGGGAPFTWQIYGGLGYAAASWVDVVGRLPLPYFPTCWQ